MRDPADLAMQAALWSLFVADPSTQGLVAGRVYDRVPPSPTFPYVQFGTVQVLDADADCAASVQVFIDVHVWSRAPGSVEARRIAEALRSAVRTVHRFGGIHPAGHHLGNIRARETRVLADPDGLTTHAVVSFEAHLDPQ